MVDTATPGNALMTSLLAPVGAPVGLHENPLTMGQDLTINEEGYEETPYIDSEGYWTVGYGELIYKGGKRFKASTGDIKAWRKSTKRADVVKKVFKVGGSLYKKYVGKSESHHKRVFIINHEKAQRKAKNVVGKLTWDKLSAEWHDVLTDLTYQVGSGSQRTNRGGLRNFTGMLKALRSGSSANAAYELTDSIRGKEQAPARAHRALQHLGVVPFKNMDFPTEVGSKKILQKKEIKAVLKRIRPSG
jgi:GH24 family phage-related lysozyme (muramidase)